MKVGDLVQHAPENSIDDHIKEIYADVGGDFKVGIVVQSRESFRWIMPERGKPAWYQVEELKIISES